MCFFPVLPAKSIQLEKHALKLVTSNFHCKMAIPHENPTGLKRQLSFPQPGHPPPPEAVGSDRVPTPSTPQNLLGQNRTYRSTQASGPYEGQKPRPWEVRVSFCWRLVFFFGGGGDGGWSNKKTRKKSVNQHGPSCWLGLLVWAFFITQKSVKGPEQKIRHLPTQSSCTTIFEKSLKITIDLLLG